MEDKLDEMIKQYPFHVKGRKRARGAIILDTSLGLFSMRECHASAARLAFEEKVKKHLVEQGYDRVDLSLPNGAGEYLTRDRYGNTWIVRKWMPGTECDIRDSRQVSQMAYHLGFLHQKLRAFPEQEENYIEKEGLLEEMKRHNRELKRVRSYIRNKKQKNQMEISLLGSFDIFYEQAIKAQEKMEHSALEQLWQKTRSEGRLCHGSYNYHNVLLDEGGFFTMNFDRTQIGVQIRDLYDLLRKVMEKNSWNPELGISLLQSYQQAREMDDAEWQVLTQLLCYPEKYWKLVNFYYNGRKSWLPIRNQEKLTKICEQENDRQKFLAILKELRLS